MAPMTERLGCARTRAVRNGSRWVGLLLAMLLAAGGVSAMAQSAAGGDLSAYISAEDARLGAAPGTIVLAQPGKLGQPVTLGRGHNLTIQAPITWAATVRLSGNNIVQCAPAAKMTGTVPGFDLKTSTGMLLSASAASNIRVLGCHVTSATQSVLLYGSPVSDLTMQGNVLSGMTLAFANSPGPSVSSERLTFSGNSVTFPAGGSHMAGLLLTSSKGVTASGNTFVGPTHGIQWWGGDSGAPGASVAQVTHAGQMTFTGNSCKDIGGACIWGSMGYDIEIRGNTADGCGDVCFDTEGGLRTKITGNTATRCGNGCGAIFFFTDQTVFSGNHFRADAPGGGLLDIKNVSANPVAHRHLTIEGNELTCLTQICHVIHQEAASEITFRNNQVTDGTWQPVAYARSVVITGNHFAFTRPITGSGAAIAGPAVIGGTALQIVGNTVNSTVQQPAGVACIAAAWSDFNAIDPGLIAGNRCGKPGAFTVGVHVVSTGKNAGLMGLWMVGNNRLGGGSVLHEAPGSREHFVDFGECGDGACKPLAAGLAQAHAIPGCAGPAPGPAAVCLGSVAGWGTVPTPP